MASPPAGQEAGASRKKTRRTSRPSETPSPIHYGPVACTSAASALVQAYLAIDTAASASSSAANPQRSNGTSTAGGSIGKAKGSLRAASDSSCFLYMSESTFDPVKRRFGGKSKPVMLPNGSAGPAAAAVGAAPGGSATAAGEGGTAASTSGSSTSSGKGARLSFSQGTKIVTTKEAMHASLHCRCVFVLLCELSSSDSSSNPSSRVSVTPRNTSKRVDTAHLVALSPDDLFCALSVDSFPLSVSPAPRGTSTDSGGGNNRSSSSSGSGRLGQRQPPLSTGTLSRAFEVIHGPVVIHRPAARQGEPWRGVEIFRPEGVGGAWKGRPVPLAAAGGGGRGNEDVDVNGGDRLADILGGGDVGNGGRAGLRLDLSAAAAAAAAAADGHGGFLDLTPPLSGGSSAGGRSKKRAGSNALLVCPPGGASFSAARYGGSKTTLFGGGGRNGLGGTERASTGADATAVVVVPATAASAPVAGGAEAEDTPPSPPQWMSLSVDHEGETSLEPWRGVPSSDSRTSPTCVCRGPDVDSGVVDLASGGALPLAAGEGGLLLRSLPPTMYVGVAVRGSRSAVAGGALLELRRGALSCHRLLPAPPSAVVTAAVDDAQGVVAVLLDDQDGTALLLARDGSDLPVVEEHRGITAVFKGDFLGNGRDQVALLSPAIASGGAVSGGSKSGKRGAAAAALKAGAGGWEQLPLKALVKRAIVTDCSCVWGNERRDITLSPPPVGGGGANGAAGVEISPQKGSPKGKKRPRPEKGREETAAGAGKVGSGANGSPGAVAVGQKPNEGPENSHRVSNLSNVVGVLRRRVRAEEARLLWLRQARRGKAAALEAAKLALAACVGGVAGGDIDDSDDDQTDGSRNSMVPRTFFDGLVAPGSGHSEMPPISTWTVERSPEAPAPAPPQCTVARVRFHAPSRALCLDAHVSNPSPGKEGDVRAPSATFVNVCLSVASASGRLTTRSAVCPRLRPGESATIRACVDVPSDLLAGGGGGVGTGGAASLFASCTWSIAGDGTAEIGTGARRPPASTATDMSSESRDSSGALRPSSSLMFSRILVSSQDMLGIGSSLSSAAHAPESTKTETGPYHPPPTVGGEKKNGSGSTSSNGGTRNGRSGGNRRQRYLGFFDVGTRLDILLWSDPATTSTTLATLPQALRSLSDVAGLPEPWAGGAAVQVNECSERAAECTLRAGDSASAPTVLMTVAARALPDGARGSADHASEQGRALVAAAAAALGEEIAALEAVARERGRLNSGTGNKHADGVGVAGERLSEALERYGAAQMKSDVLAARLAGRVVAAQGGAL